MSIGRRDFGEYIEVVCEVYYDRSRRKNGVRPVSNEFFPQSMKVECARKIRELAIGTKIILFCVEKDRPGCRPYLYSSYKWAYNLID